MFLQLSLFHYTLLCNVINNKKQDSTKQKNIWLQDIYLVSGSTLDLKKWSGNKKAIKQTIIIEQVGLIYGND